MVESNVARKIKIIAKQKKLSTRPFRVNSHKKWKSPSLIFSKISYKLSLSYVMNICKILPKLIQKPQSY